MGKEPTETGEAEEQLDQVGLKECMRADGGIEVQDQVINGNRESERE